MTTPTQRATPKVKDERAALEQSEKKASATEPGSFNERAMTEKIVEVLPMGKAQAPIKGLDPKPAR